MRASVPHGGLVPAAWQAKLVGCVNADWNKEPYHYHSMNTVGNKTTYVFPTLDCLLPHIVLCRETIIMHAYTSIVSKKYCFHKRIDLLIA